ncbi:MAG: bifunctional adenosylcobinamide kinase/adenosylcobinamide-phosphate guanylyltransferase [Clostridiaceae bacterium]
MGRIILVTGGSRSGKSTFGEKYFENEKEVLYIATAQRVDGEMDERIKKHRERRPSEWLTHEGHTDLDIVVSNSGRYILLDCVTNMINNLIFDNSENMDEPTKEETEKIFKTIKNEFEKLVYALKNIDGDSVLITNEVGMGLISEYKLGRIFTDFTGFINQYLASMADEVYFMVSGIPMRIKG